MKLHVHSQSPYSLSFVLGGLFLPETLALLAWAAKPGENESLKSRVMRENPFQARTLASRTRLYREIKYRLDRLRPEEALFLGSASPTDQRLLLFVAVCLQYDFVREWIDEVILPKLASHDRRILPSDFERFWDAKAAGDPSLGARTPKTRAKVRQVLLRMMAEAGLMENTRSLLLHPGQPSSELCALLARREANRLRFLLLSPEEIRHWNH